MPISIITLQRRQAELGRIRLGQKNPDKGFPMKLDKFRFTSVSETYIRDLAELYGGTAQPWDNSGIPSWEVITEATTIPVIVVKGGLSQWMEFWAGGGCMHRCDGQVQVDGTPCDTDEQVKVGKKTVNPHAEAKPTTRLSVMLPELEAIGVFRMESHGWNAAAEIPAVAELAQFVGDLVPAQLHLVERRAIKDGQTSRFVVPVLDLKIGAAKLREIVEAKSGVAEVGSTAATPAIGAGADPYVDLFALVDAATSLDELHGIWASGVEDGLLGSKSTPTERQSQFVEAFKAKGGQLKGASESPPGEVVHGEVVDEDADAVWQKVLARAGELSMGLWDVDDDFKAFSGMSTAEGNAAAFSAYLAELQGRDAA